MGCFNMRCAATGVPIMYGTNVVMFDLVESYPHHIRKDFGPDIFGDRYTVMSMPRYGVYNDYGDIEDEEDRGWAWIDSHLKMQAQNMNLFPKFEGDRADCDEEEHSRDRRMFILREAYELMIEHDNTDEKWYGADFTTWGERRAQNQMMFNQIVNLEDEKSKELIEAGNDKVLARMMGRMRAEDHAFVGFGLDREDKSVWLDLMMGKPEVGPIYYKYISKMRRSTHAAEWSLLPSKYSGQTIDKDILVMRQIGTRYLETYFKEMEQEDD